MESKDDNKQIEEIVKSAKILALENAIKFNGKANQGAVIGGLMSKYRREKNPQEITALAQSIVKEINLLNLKDQKKQLLLLNPEFHSDKKKLKQKRKIERKKLPELKNAVMGKVVTRIPPEPSKYNHIGHALSFLLNYMYAIKYDGKAILRFEDTNPEKEAQEFVDAMQEDVLKYLNIKPSKTVFVSDHIDKYYSFAEILIQQGKAFTCTCKSEEISKNRRSMKECECRKKTIKVISQEWENMKNGKYEEGAITLRLKINMKHNNAVMRDPVIFRLCYSPHYRQKTKYKVWPMYDFENAIEEGLLGITHVLRSNEFDSRIELQDYIRNFFGLSNPIVKQYARFNITGAITQGRKIRKLIETGNYRGWDDPRLITLRALKKRGIVKESLYELARIVGMSKTTSNLDFSIIASINRKILDEKALRYFFIEDPIKINIEGCKEKIVELDLHPHLKKKGRIFKIKKSFFLSKKDLDSINENEIFRLMDCMNCTKRKGNIKYVDNNLETFKSKGKKIIHWIPEEEAINVKLLTQENKIIIGKGEKSISKVKNEEIVQFERFGFCKLNNDLFWFGHK